MWKSRCNRPLPPLIFENGVLWWWWQSPALRLDGAGSRLALAGARASTQKFNPLYCCWSISA
jgi:hypothetical protein